MPSDQPPTTYFLLSPFDRNGTLNDLLFDIKPRLVLAPSWGTYQDMVAFVASHYPEIKPNTITLLTKNLTMCPYEMVEITEEVWPLVKEELSTHQRLWFDGLIRRNKD